MQTGVNVNDLLTADCPMLVGGGYPLCPCLFVRIVEPYPATAGVVVRDGADIGVFDPVV